MTTILATLAIGLISQAHNNTQITPEQFSRIIAASNELIHDVAFMYEGETKYVGPLNLLRKNTPEKIGSTFQGTYIYRNDGSVLLDSYQRLLDPTSPLGHCTETLFNSRMERKQWSHRQDGTLIRPVSSAGDVGSLSGPRSPQHFYFLPYLASLKTFDDSSLKVIGWEPIDDHKCLRIEHYPIGRDNPDPRFSPITNYWIDIDRGGHVLKATYTRNGRIAGMTDKIELIQVDNRQGSKVWLPVSGTTSSYVWNGTYESSPVHTEHQYVISDTLLLDQGWPDTVFTSDVKSPELLKLTKLHQLTVKAAFVEKTRDARAKRDNIVDSSRKLAERLADAKAQGKLVDGHDDAPLISNEALIQISLSTIGIVLIGFALYKIRNQR